MKLYQLCIKSHCEAPDYEEEYEAENFEDALNHFMHSLGDNGWETDTIAKMIHCEDECPECHTDLVKQLETRDGGNFEEVEYCSGCGSTGIRKASA